VCVFVAASFSCNLTFVENCLSGTTLYAKMAGKMPTAATIEEVLTQLSDEKLLGRFDDIYKLVPVTEATSCGFGICRGAMLQK